VKIEHLQYFVALATSPTPSITKTAEELFISQQQLNRIISALEEDMNCKLINRSTKGVSLTENGKDFLSYAQNILKEYSSMKHHFYMQTHNIQKNVSGEIAKVKISLPPTLAIYSHEIVKRLKVLAPNIRLSIEENNLLPVDNFNNALFFWVMALPEDTTKYQCISLDEIDIYVAHRKDKCLPKSIELVQDHDLFLPHADYSAIDPDEILFISSNLNTLIEMVVESDTILHVPDFCLPKLNEKFPDVGFKLIPGEKLKLNIVYSPTYTLTEADKIVIDFLKSYIKNLQLLAQKL